MMCKLLGISVSPSLVILTYHTVKTSDITSFKKQMDMVLNTCSPVSLNGRISEVLSDYHVAVSFDDAYQSILQNALPILQSKNIPATIFVPTGCLGKRPLWIKDKNHKYAGETVVTKAQLKALSNDLITIGSHTVFHINLTKVDESIARREIFESKETLEIILDKKVSLFAAPYGMLNEKFTDLFKQAGYERIFLNIPTFPATKIDSYILGRISVEPNDWAIEYRLKITGAYQWLPFAINLKKKLRYAAFSGHQS